MYIQVIGIAFNLILIRAAQHHGSGGGEGTVSMPKIEVLAVMSFAHRATSSDSVQEASAASRHIDDKIVTDGDPQAQSVDVDEKA